MHDTRKRVLVVHLDDVISESVSAALLAAGYQSGAAWQHRDILSLLESDIQFDLLLFHVGALEAEHRLREWTVDGNWSHIPVVLIAPRAPAQIPQRIYQRSRALLRVPFDQDQMLAVVQEALDVVSEPSP